MGDSSSETQRRRVYVTGHRNPDLDSIASAIGYAELKSRQDPTSDYVAVRLGSVNAQAAWALERSEASKPELMEHVMLRVRDVMRERFPVAHYDEPLREVGRTMARDDLDIVPIVGGDGELGGGEEGPEEQQQGDEKGPGLQSGAHLDPSQGLAVMKENVAWLEDRAEHPGEARIGRFRQHISSPTGRPLLGAATRKRGPKTKSKAGFRPLE